VIHQPVFMVSQCGADAWLKDWLAEISADLRRVRDDALDISAVTLLHLRSHILNFINDNCSPKAGLKVK